MFDISQLLYFTIQKMETEVEKLTEAALFNTQSLICSRSMVASARRAAGIKFDNRKRTAHLNVIVSISPC